MMSYLKEFQGILGFHLLSFLPSSLPFPFWKTASLQENHQALGSSWIALGTILSGHSRLHYHFEPTSQPKLEEADLGWRWGRILSPAGRNLSGFFPDEKRRIEKANFKLSWQEPEWKRQYSGSFSLASKTFALERTTKPERLTLGFHWIASSVK